jgi:outer membrane murein-binding lipoprotein Lpp
MAAEKELEQREARLADAPSNLMRLQAEKAAASSTRCEELEHIQKKYMPTICEANKPLQQEKQKLIGNEKCIRELQSDIETLKSVVSQMSTFQMAAASETQQETLLRKEMPDMRVNLMLKEDNGFLHERTKSLKSQLRGVNATRVRQLENQVEALRKDVALLRSGWKRESCDLTQL